jgi:hypothetical protein
MIILILHEKRKTSGWVFKELSKTDAAETG